MEKKERSFRDKISTTGDSGERVWVYADKPKGKLTNYRFLTATALIIFLFAAPFAKINGNPLILLNFPERYFVFFGTYFWPQDIYILFVLVLSFLVFVFLFTVTFGRIWCGWACPQTIFMEFVFRQIEYLIEGNPHKQKLLDSKPLDLEKFWKKTLKHFIFFVISFLIANIFLSYIIGIESLLKIVSEPPKDHIKGLIAITIFSGIFYFVFAKLREQVCCFFCPYGRLQGVLIDPDSIIVAYDYKRGEPRGNNASDSGDCIDCKQCVKVCPTGIDIRNGSQLECVNCTACIDSCNAVMSRIGKPKGLIRMASENEIQFGKKLRFTPKIIAYLAVFIVLLFTVFFLFNNRKSIEATIYRTPGTVYQVNGDSTLSNLFSFKVLNKKRENLNIELKLINTDGRLQIMGENPFVLHEGQAMEGRFFVFLPKEKVSKQNSKIKIEVLSNGIVESEKEVNFISE